MSAEGESHTKYPKNNEEGNIIDGEIWVNMNESRNDNPSKLLQTGKDLKE